MENIEIWILEKITDEMDKTINDIEMGKEIDAREKLEYWSLQIRNVHNVLVLYEKLKALEAKHI